MSITIEKGFLIVGGFRFPLRRLFELIFKDANAVESLRRFLIENNLECVLK